MKNLIFLVGILLSISINAQQFTAEQNFTGTVNGSVVVYDSNKDGFDNSFIFTGGKLAFSGSTVPLIGESWDITSGGFSSSQLTTSPGQHDVQIIFNVQNDDTTCDYLHFYADGSDGSVTPYQAPHVELKEEQVDGTYLIHENTGLPAMRIGQGFAYDVDSDKLMDIFINGEIMDTNGNYSYHAGWYKNNGDFTFTLEQTFTGLSAGTADIGNLDGLFGKDIIYTGVDNNASIRMIYLKHNGSGFDQIELDQTGGFTPIVLGSIAFGYNKDGDDFVDYIAITGATCCAAVAQLKKKTGTGFFTEDITPPFPGLYRSTLLFLESNSGLPNLYAHGRAADDTLHSDIFRNVDGSTFEQGFAFPGIELGFAAEVHSNNTNLPSLIIGGSRTNQNLVTTFYQNNEETLSIEDVDVDPELMSVYPNPTKGLVTIKLPQNDTIKALTVSDVNGRIIVRGEEDNSVNFEKFNNGVYFLKFITGYGKTVFEKIVKI